jgi:hypothetical protein
MNNYPASDVAELSPQREAPEKLTVSKKCPAVP